MRLRTFIPLTLVTFLAVAAAAVMAARESRPVAVAGAGDPVLPRLLENANRIEAINLHTADKSLTLALTDGGWVIRDRGNYPAAFEKVKALVLGLAQLKKLEPKTDKPESYARIGVEDVTPGALSTEVTLLDTTGATVAALILGEESLSGGEGRYVRVPGETRSWLASGAIRATPELRDWALPQVVDIAMNEVEEVRIHRPDGSTLTASRSDPSSGQLTFRDLPAGRRLRQADAADELAGALAAVELEDVRPAVEVPFAPAATTEVRITAQDGLVIQMELTEKDGQTWVRFKPSAPPGAAAETTARVADIADRTRDWAYRLPAWRTSPFTRSINELTEPDKPS